MFRSPLQRLAFRLHLAAESAPDAPLSESGMELAMILNLGVAIAGLVMAWLAGAPPWAAIAAAVVTFVLLGVALFHRVARWISVALGTALAVGIGVELGSLGAGSVLATVAGGAIGLLVAAVTYGSFVASVLRRSPRGPGSSSS